MSKANKCETCKKVKPEKWVEKVTSKRDKCPKCGAKLAPRYSMYSGRDARKGDNIRYSCGTSRCTGRPSLWESYDCLHNQLAQRGKDCLQFQRHRDWWRSHAYGEGERPSDYLDNSPGSRTEPTTTELLAQRDETIKQLQKAINDFGNNPMGFDWAVLGRIDELERENERLQAIESKIQDYAHHAMQDGFDEADGATDPRFYDDTADESRLAQQILDEVVLMSRGMTVEEAVKVVS